MKKVIILIFLSLNLLGQKKPTDVIDFNNFDYVYAEKLLVETFNSELSKLVPNKKPFENDSIGLLTMEYQLSNFKSGVKLSHFNENKFRGILLVTFEDRLEYFLNKEIKNQCIEVLMNGELSYKIRDTTKKDYYVEKNGKFIKTEKKSDGEKYYTYNKLENSYKYTDDSNVLYNDHITYDYLIKNICFGFLYETEKHSLYIKLAYSLNFCSSWKIEVKKVNNYVQYWAGSIFYNKKNP